MQSKTIGFLAAVALGVLLAGSPSAQCETTRAYGQAPEIGAKYGSSVVLELPRMFVGEPERSDGGRVHIQTLSGSNFFLEQFLAPASLAPADEYGATLAVDANLLVVGAPFSAESGLTAGAVFVYEEVNGLWSEVAVILPPLPVAGSEFGFALDIEDERIVIGEAEFSDTTVTAGGRVHIFDRIGGVWVLSQSLLPSYIHDKQLFGFSVAIDGADLAIGAPFEIPFASTFSELGSVYMFAFDGSTWAETDRIQPLVALKKWQFGSSVDLVPDRLLAGAQSADAFTGLSYVLDRDTGGNWIESATLKPDGNSMFSDFGSDVRLSEDGGTAVIAAGGDSFPFQRAGAVYLFEDNGGAWTLDQKLQPLDQVATVRYGSAIAIQGSVLAVGVSDSDAQLDRAGAVHLHSLDDSACSSLVPTARSLSLGSGGLVTFLVNAGPEFAGKTYLIAGSLSGSDPGFLLDGLRVPLNQDFYFSFLTTVPNTALFSGNMGSLNSLGQGAGFLNIPAAAFPSLAGTIIFHAAVVLDSDGTLLHVSDANLLRLDS